MAYLDHWQAEGIPEINGFLLNQAREDLRNYFWTWYEEHKNDTIASLRVLFFTVVKVQVKDVRFIFESLFGSPR